MAGLDLDTLFPSGLRGMIFDCDGVLIDSRDANIGYYNRLLAEFGHPPMPKSIADYAQMSSVQQAFEAIFSPAELEALPQVLQRVRYSEVSLPLLRLEAGILDVLHVLKERELRAAVHTNRGSGMWDVLDKFSLHDFFDPVMTVEKVAPKPDPEGVLQILEAWKLPAETVAFVGDSSTDAGAAAGAGVPFIAYRNEDVPAALHVSAFADLRQALLRMKEVRGRSL